MKMIKKLSMLLLIVLLCTPMLVSCVHINPEDSETTEEVTSVALPESPLEPFVLPAGGYDGSEVTVGFYHTMDKDSAAVLDRYIAEFNKLYPNIRVTPVAFEGDSALYNAVGGSPSVGERPSLVSCSADIAALFAEAKYAVGLNDLIDSDLSMTDAAGNQSVLGLTDAQVSDFIEAFYLDSSRFEDGARYILPFSRDTEVLYYNKTFFEEKAIGVPETWDDLHSFLPILQAYGVNTVHGAYSSGVNLFLSLSGQHGSEYTSATGKHYLFHNEANHAIVERIVDFFTFWSTPAGDVYESDISVFFKNTDPSAKTCYLVIASSSEATRYCPKKSDGAYPFEVGIAPLPQVDPSNPRVMTHGSNLCIFNDEDPQRVVASWLFAKYLTTSAAFQAELSMASGHMPVLRSAIELPAYQDFLSEADGGDHITALAIKVSLAQEEAFFAPPAFAGSYKAYEAMDRLIRECVYTDKELDPGEFVPKAFEAALRECEKGN